MTSAISTIHRRSFSMPTLPTLEFCDSSSSTILMLSDLIQAIRLGFADDAVQKTVLIQEVSKRISSLIKQQQQTRPSSPVVDDQLERWRLEHADYLEIFRKRTDWLISNPHKYNNDRPLRHFLLSRFLFLFPTYTKLV